jgi:hypothetical protein
MFGIDRTRLRTSAYKGGQVEVGRQGYQRRARSADPDAQPSHRLGAFVP